MKHESSKIPTADPVEAIHHINFLKSFEVFTQDKHETSEFILAGFSCKFISCEGKINYEFL